MGDSSQEVWRTNIPAQSQKQQEAMAIALHSPDKLYSRNEGLKSMSQSDLHDFASTPRKGLPVFRGKKKTGGLHNLPSTSSGSNEGMSDSNG